MDIFGYFVTLMFLVAMLIIQDLLSGVERTNTSYESALQKAQRFADRREAAEYNQSMLSPTQENHRVAGQQHPTAFQAEQLAGIGSNIVMDIGLLGYGDDGAAPELYRERRVPDTVAYTRPFIVLNAQQSLIGVIRFTLSDADEVLHFIDDIKWVPDADETLVYPETWLPVNNLGDDPEGQWLMRVYLDGQLVAVHEFRWRDEGGGAFRGYLDGDGEISDDLIAELSDVQLAPLSLDDLLGDDDITMLD